MRSLIKASTAVIVFWIGMQVKAELTDAAASALPSDGAPERAISSALPIWVLLHDPNVQSELNLSRELRGTLQKLAINYAREEQVARAAVNQGLKQSLDRERSHRLKESDERGRELASRQLLIKLYGVEQRKRGTDFEAAVVEMLDDAQCRRLQQIVIQLSRAATLLQPQVIGALGMSRAQVHQLQAIQQDGFRVARQLRVTGETKGMTKEQMLERISALERQMLADSLSILSQEQCDTYRALCGPPIGFCLEDVRLEVRIAAQVNDDGDPNSAGR